MSPLIPEEEPQTEPRLRVERREWQGELFYVEPSTAFIYDLKSGSAVGTWDDQRGPKLMMHYNNLSPATLERDAQKLRPWKLRSSAFSRGEAEEKEKQNVHVQLLHVQSTLNDQNLHKSNM